MAGSEALYGAAEDSDASHGDDDGGDGGDGGDDAAAPSRRSFALGKGGDSLVDPLDLDRASSLMRGVQDQDRDQDQSAALQRRTPAMGLRGSRSLSPFRLPLGGEAMPVLPASAARGRAAVHTRIPPLEASPQQQPSASALATIMAQLGALGGLLRDTPITIHPPPLTVEVHPAPKIVMSGGATAAGERAAVPSRSLFARMPRLLVKTHPDHNHVEARIGDQNCRLPLPSFLSRPHASAAAAAAAHPMPGPASAAARASCHASWPAPGHAHRWRSDMESEQPHFAGYDSATFGGDE